MTVKRPSALTAKQAQDQRPALRVLRDLCEKMSSAFLPSGAFGPDARRSLSSLCEAWRPLRENVFCLPVFVFSEGRDFLSFRIPLSSFPWAGASASLAISA